jgi:predicted ATPase/DNA-binding winged helix-turn-helix (wHTH) protein
VPAPIEPPATADGEPAIAFGPFRLLPAQRLLLEGERPVRLGSRAFDILTALVERAGEVIGKDELMARVWPQTVVEEANLKIQISALRRALGDGQGGYRFVVTVPGRGYNFVAPVSREETSRASSAPSIAPAGFYNLPAMVTRMIGREEAEAAIRSRLSRQRLVTIVGPGGVGKTTLALAVGEQTTADYQHGVWLIELAPLGDPRLVPSTVATVLGLEIRTEDPLPGLIAGLRDKRMLLLLDNCEHVIDAAANLAAAVLGGVPRVDILATSREPLGVAGEHEYRLGPLSSPQRSSQLTAVEAAAFPAIQLFVERISAVVEDFALTDANAAPVVEICQRLDGLPLAIEFAAPRVEVLGVEGLAADLGDGLPGLGTRRRATLPRHRTMRAVLDWSYGLLSGDEQQFFRALGIFAGGFTVEAAMAVAIDAADTPGEAIDRLADLVAKSLVVADVSGAGPRFRLLDTTRAFAIEQVAGSGESERTARSHAEYYCCLFKRAEDEAPARPADEWLADYAPEIDNLRTALDWAFSPGGDGAIGVALTAAAFSLWMRLSLFEECRSRAKHGLGSLGTGENWSRREEMRLYAALGASMSDPSEMSAAFAKALEIAESLDDTDYRLRALSGLYYVHIWLAQYRAALSFAQQFYDLANTASDRYDQLFGERTIGVAKHYLGDQVGARRHLEQTLIHYSPNDNRLDFIRFQSELRVSTRIFLARTLWLLGFSDQASRLAEESIAEARATGHASSLCLALALAACPLALWVGNLSEAARYAQMLVDHTRERHLPGWSAYGHQFHGVVLIREGNHDQSTEPNLGIRSVTVLAELAKAFALAGRVSEGLAAVEAGIELSDEGCATPELLRLKGELLLAQGASGATALAEDCFSHALDCARQQGALSWELRAAMSLARLLRNQGRPTEAVACLRPVYDRFTEGFGTADLAAARVLLGELGDARHD